MTIAAPLNRLAVCGALAWLTIGNGGLLFGEEGWAPVHTTRKPVASLQATPPARATMVQRVAFQEEAEPIPSPPPVFTPPKFTPPEKSPAKPSHGHVTASPPRTGGAKSCKCEHCAGPSPRRQVAGKSAVEKPACLVYEVMDGVAGGIEHVLRLKSPSERCGRSGVEVASCGCAECGKRPAAPRVSPNRVRALPQRLAPPSSTAVPMPPTVPMHIDTPLVDPPTAPLSHPIEELEPQALPRLPAPVVPDEMSDPFKDDQAWRPGRNAAIKRSAYFE